LNHPRGPKKTFKVLFKKNGFGIPKVIGGFGHPQWANEGGLLFDHPGAERRRATWGQAPLVKKNNNNKIKNKK
jgi:hypothetical protein